MIDQSALGLSRGVTINLARRLSAGAAGTDFIVRYAAGPEAKHALDTVPLTGWICRVGAIGRWPVESASVRSIAVANNFNTQHLCSVCLQT